MKWTPEIEAKLGTVPDKTIAAEIGCSVQAVYQRRRKLGIPACSPRENSPHMSREAVQRLRGAVIRALEYHAGTHGCSRSAIARAAGVSLRQVGRWIDGHDTPSQAGVDAIRAWLANWPVDGGGSVSYLWVRGVFIGGPSIWLFAAGGLCQFIRSCALRWIQVEAQQQTENNGIQTRKPAPN